MSVLGLRRRIDAALATVDVRLDGPRPFDPQIHDERLFGRVLRGGTLALGEAYVDGLWECAQLDELFHRALRAGVDLLVPEAHRLRGRLHAVFANPQRPSRAHEIGRRHYDLGNDLFDAMLDARRIYSCAYWPVARSLDDAQEAKLDLVCRKLGLKPGMRVLDLGCGFGGAARFAAERYQVAVVGLTVSREQARVARAHCAGLPVEVRLQDYRDLEGRFDAAWSLGMLEHVGRKNYRRYFDTVRRHLDPDGLFLAHTIGSPRSVASNDPWIERYVFPRSMLPSAAQLADAIEGRFVLEDWHGFGADYDRTLLAWHANFEAAWPTLAPRYGERFHRLWRYYLLSCAGGFRARHTQLWQLVLSPAGVPGGYRSVR